MGNGYSKNINIYKSYDIILLAVLADAAAERDRCKVWVHKAIYRYVVIHTGGNSCRNMTIACIQR